MTALDADTTHCALEISLVAWSVDADGMLLFHRHIWEMTDHIKAMDSTDFRMPTEGDESVCRQGNEVGMLPQTLVQTGPPKGAKIGSKQPQPRAREEQIVI